MSIYTKSKTTVSSVNVVKNRVVDENTSMKVSFNPDHVNLIIEYLTNLYADAPTAVVRELFTNACDADPNGFVEVTIEEDFESNSNTFIIMDKGVGMNKEQLTDNYIQYANSTKTSEFNTVGSFGLGSKSPMAITSEYEVESCDGNKIHKAIVQRIESGIYANIDEIGESSDSYTKVTVHHISNLNIQRMKKFLQYLANYSGRQIILNNEMLKRDDDNAFSCKVSEDDAVYDIRIFAPNLEDKDKMNMFVSYYKNGGKNFNTIIRVNNTPYTVQRYEDKCCGSILIDVEPGYFSFAPPREEIPSGEKKDHIIEIANSNVFDDVADFISFISENEYVDDAQIFDSCLRKNLLTGEFDIDQLCNTGYAVKNHYKDIYNVKNNTQLAKEKFAKLFKDCYISVYGKSNFKTVALDIINEGISTDELLHYISNRMGDPIKKFTDSVKQVEYVKLYTGAKKNRNGVIKYPKGYGKRSIAEEIRTFTTTNDLFGRVCDRASTWKVADIIGIHIITESDSISNDALDYLKFINIKDEDGDPCNVEVIAEKFDYEIKPSSTPRVKTEFEDKVIEYRTTRFPTHNKVRVGDIVDTFNPEEYAIITDRDFLANDHLSYLAYKGGKKFIYFDYRAKKFLQFLKDNGYDFLELEFIHADFTAGIKPHYLAHNSFSMQFIEYLNSEDKKEYIIKNDHALLMGAIANHHDIPQSFYKYLNVKIIEMPDNMQLYMRNRFKFWNKELDYNKEFLDSFDSNKFFKDHKKALVNKAKNDALSSISFGFHKYFENEIEPVVKIDIPKEEWKKKVISYLSVNKELESFKKKLVEFKQLSFYEFSSTITHGLDMNNPIHKVIQETMDKEIKEFFT